MCGAASALRYAGRQSRRAGNNTQRPTVARMNATRESERAHTRQLLALFCLWKALLLTLAAFCPGPGYDTSALILLKPGVDRHQSFSSFSRFDRIALNLFRWDAAYFVSAAEKGKAHEQEWAFSWAYSKVLRFSARRK